MVIDLLLSQTHSDIPVFMLKDPLSLQIRVDRSVASASTWDRCHWQCDWMHMWGTYLRAFLPGSLCATLLTWYPVLLKVDLTLKKHTLTQITLFFFRYMTYSSFDPLNKWWQVLNKRCPYVLPFQEGQRFVIFNKVIQPVYIFNLQLFKLL